MMKPVIFVVAIACLAAISQARSVMHGRHLVATNPRVVAGNPTCADLVTLNILPSGTYEQFKIEPVQSGIPSTFDTAMDGPFNEGTTTSSGTITIPNNAYVVNDGEYTSFPSFAVTDLEVAALIVKGGQNGANVYLPSFSGPYQPPLNNNGKVPEISHITFCLVLCETLYQPVNVCPGSTPPEDAVTIEDLCAA